jgi:hypothetical protein
MFGLMLGIHLLFIMSIVMERRRRQGITFLTFQDMDVQLPTEIADLLERGGLSPDDRLNALLLMGKVRKLHGAGGMVGRGHHEYERRLAAVYQTLLLALAEGRKPIYSDVKIIFLAALLRDFGQLESDGPFDMDRTIDRLRQAALGDVDADQPFRTLLWTFLWEDLTPEAKREAFQEMEILLRKSAFGSAASTVENVQAFETLLCSVGDERREVLRGMADLFHVADLTALAALQRFDPETYDAADLPLMLLRPEALFEDDVVFGFKSGQVLDVLSPLPSRNKDNIITKIDEWILATQEPFYEARISGWWRQQKPAVIKKLFSKSRSG